MNDANYGCLTTGEDTTEKISDFQVGMELFSTSFNRRQATIIYIIHPRVHSTPFHLSSIRKNGYGCERFGLNPRTEHQIIRVYCAPKSNPTIMTNEGIVQYTCPESNLSFAEVDLWETRKKR